MFQNLFGTLGTKSPGSLPSPEPLLKAMYGVAQKDTRDSRDVLYGEFLKCWLWLCTPELPEGWKPGMTTLSTGMNIQITTPNNARGEKVCRHSPTEQLSQITTQIPRTLHFLERKCSKSRYASE